MRILAYQINCVSVSVEGRMVLVLVLLGPSNFPAWGGRLIDPPPTNCVLSPRLGPGPWLLSV